MEHVRGVRLRPDSGRQLGWFSVARAKKPGALSGDQVVHLHVGAGNSEREADADEVEALDQIEDGQLSRAIEEIRTVEGAKAEVHRVLPAERQGFCRSYPVSVFSHERIAADYGAGKYRVRFKGPGDKYIKGGGTFDIAEGLNPQSSQPGAPPTGIKEFLDLMKERDAREQADREKRKADWLEWAKILAPLALPKLLDIIGGGSKGLGPAEMVRMMKDLQDLQGPRADLKSQFESVVSVLQGARELVGDDGGKSTTGSTWPDLVKALLESPALGALAGAVPGLMARPGPLPLPQPAVAALPRQPAPVQPPPAASSGSAPSTGPESSNSHPEATDVGLLEQLTWLRGTLDQLVPQAVKGANARLYAEVVLDNLPKHLITEEALREQLSAENWLTRLAQVDNRVQLHAEWFTKFRNYAVRVLDRRARQAAAAAGPPPMDAGLPGPNEPMQEGEGGE